MKPTIKMLILLLVSISYSQNNACDDNCYTGDLLNKPINATNWTVNCLSPSFNNTANQVWIWSYGNRGESVSTNFNFQSGKTYCITLDYRLSAVRTNTINANATFNVLATNGLANCTGVNYATYTNQQPILSELYNNHIPKVNSGNFNTYQTLFNPSIAFTDILLIPKNADNGRNGVNANQVNFEIRNLQIREVITCPCSIKANIKSKYLQDCGHQFYANAIAGTGTSIKGYLWDFGDGTTSTQQDPIHYYTTPGNYLVTLTVYGTDKNGNCCTETFNTKVIIKKVCPQDCKITSSFNVVKQRPWWSRRYDLINTSTSNAFTTIVGYEWYINGVLVSTQKDLKNYRGRGKNACLIVYGIDKNGNCCSDKYCKTLK